MRQRAALMRANSLPAGFAAAHSKYWLEWPRRLDSARIANGAVLNIDPKQRRA